MTALETALHTLIGREPTSEEIAKFYKIKEACGFSDHDSVWSMLLAFGHYEILYREIPSLITEQATKTLADHKLALEATGGAVERAVKTSLAESVREATTKALEEAKHASNVLAAIKAKKNLVIGSVLSLGLAVALVLTAVWLGYSLGKETARGAAAWAQSADGVSAKRFAELNSLRPMLECREPYQVHKEGANTYCIPFDTQTKKTFGWRIN